MEFHDYATTETSALITRLLASQSGASRHQLETLRDAVEAAVRAFETAPPIDSDIQALIERLTEAAADDVRRVRETAQDSLDAARAELDGQRAENEQLAVALGEVDGAAAQLRLELQNERERADGAERDLNVTVEAHAEVEGALHKVEAECRHEIQAKARAEDELQESRGLLEVALEETEQLRLQVEVRDRENVTGQGELTAARGELERIGNAHAQLETDHQALGAARRDDAQARAAVDEQLQEVRGQLGVERAETAQLRSELENRTAEISWLHGELAGVREAHSKLETAHRSFEAASEQDAQTRAGIEGQLQETHGLLELALAETEQLRGQLNGMTSENAAIKGELVSAREAHEHRDGLASQLETSSARLQSLEGAQAQHDEDVRHLEGRLDETLQAEARLREQLASDNEAVTGILAEAGSLRDEVDRMASLLDAAVLAVDALASSTTVSELLAALATRLASQFSRVAIFRVKGKRLEGEHQAGFDETTDVTKLVIPLGVDSLLTRVVSTRAPECVIGGASGSRTVAPFTGTPSHAVGLPIILQDETLAVVYADHSEPSAGTLDGSSAVRNESSVAFAKLLIGQAVVLLARHTNELKTLTEMREYAAMLLQEAEHMYTADAEAGKSTAELRKRLKDNLDCGRQLYGHRADLEGTAAAALLDEQILHAIEPDTHFAKDLAAVVGQKAESRVYRTAEAS